MSDSTAPSASARHYFAPEVIQTSGMDCGPASLKCLLEGFGIPAHYGRLREACHTAVDGTSIDTLESVAGMLGLEAEQIMLPVEHVLLPQAAALPALAVVVLPSGLTHFVVVWRTAGRWVQVMDPGRGRLWVPKEKFLREVYVHEQAIPAAGFREWAGTDDFLAPLRVRMRAAGIGGAKSHIDRALADDGWRGLAELDAATRAVEKLRAEKVIAKSGARAAFEALMAARDRGELPFALGDDLWTARSVVPTAPPAAPPHDEEQVTLRGAVLLRVLGPKATPAAVKGEEPAAELPAVPTDLAAVTTEREPSPGRTLLDLLRADGVWRFGPLLAALLIASAGAAFEALLFRSFFAVGRHLVLFEQRLLAVVAMMVFVGALMALEWPMTRELWAIGRRLELRLRRAFLRKIPRVEDRYFQSRLVSDMAERAHYVHRLRILPGQGGMLVRTAAELLMTTLGIIWIHPPSAPLAVGLLASVVIFPMLFQPGLAERDLRMQSHAGGLVRFYLDGLLGLFAIRAHHGEETLKTEHDDRLREWARSAWAAARLTVTSEAIQGLMGFGFAAWLVFDYLHVAPTSGWMLLLAYWTLVIPSLGQEFAFLLQQYPTHRNVTLRILEPLTAQEGHSPTHGGSPDQGSDLSVASAGKEEVTWAPPRGGVEVRLNNVRIEIAGQEILSTETLTIAPGSHVAIVGPSGAGKSSLVGLLLGWQPATDGQVLIDGEPLDPKVLARLRRQTVWVEPNVYLWNRSLLDNLRYGAEDEELPVATALEEADLNEVLGRLPMGLQTALGEGGTLLSGGEGQRVRLGRAIQRGGARLVILDEAFRGLERPRRKALLDRLRKRWENATFIFVSHDIDHTLEFERVLVIAGGRVVEDGPPGQLAATPDSRYQQLLAAEQRVRKSLDGVEWRKLRVENGHLTETGAPGGRP